MACLMVPGIQESLAKSQARTVYLSNLMTRRTQTHGMSAGDHLRGIERALGRKLDAVILNSAALPPEILTRYAAEDEHEVVDDLRADSRVIRADIAATVTVEQSSLDTAHRSLLRHDPKKLHSVFSQLLASKE
jgi:uncharacterized cofD-like protein